MPPSAQGTARSSFVKGSRRVLPFEVAGKTGTLAQRDPYLHYNWFVGFAPADNPRVAFSVVVGSEGPSVKAAALARDVLRETPVGPHHRPSPRDRPKFVRGALPGARGAPGRRRGAIPGS